MAKKHLYAEIAKTEDQDDGTIKVWGWASSGAEDSDGETITADCMKNAIPDYMKFGAVREMHQPLAAGTAIEAKVEEDGRTWFGAHVVDPIAVKKVHTGVYKGFSVGGKVPPGGRDPLNKKVINKLNLIEVSLVDRPANPEAVITLMKVQDDESDVEELAKLLDAGSITPAKLLELAKAAQGEEKAIKDDAPPVVADGGVKGTSEATADPVAKADEVKKGMYSVSEFARLLESLASLCCSAGWEAQYEGDNSPIPAALMAWVKTGTAIFADMAAEEAAEMMAQIATAGKLTESVMSADKVAKASRRFTKATKAALSGIHKACKEAGDHLDGLKYADEPDEEEEPADKVAKGIETQGALAEFVPPDFDGMIAKALAPYLGSLAEMKKENSDLKDQVTKMGKMAAPGKALLKAVAVTKVSDVASPEPEKPAEVIPEFGTVARAEYEMRKALQTGQRLVG